MYVYRNTEARSCNQCCNERAMSITQPLCEFVALGIHHAMRIRYIAICGLPRSTISIPHYLIKGTIFGKSY